MLSLFDLKEGEKGYITKVKGRGNFRKRIMEMGFIVGKDITVIQKAPLKDPVKYRVMGYDVTLRNNEAKLIEVVREDDFIVCDHEEVDACDLVYDVNCVKKAILERSHTIHVALVGNPNSGKTTLFNYASGSREKVGNYAGVTVDAKEANYQQGDYTINIFDLPGAYSLSCYSPEELYVRNYIFDQVPDVVVNIVDASNIERNLYLTTQLVDMGIQVVMALNMFDELQKKGDVLDYQSLGKLLGIPIVPTVASKGKGIKELFDKVIEVYQGSESTFRHIHINYGNTIEESVSKIQQKIKIEENNTFVSKFSPRFLSIKLLEGDANYTSKIEECVNQNEIINVAKVEVERLKGMFSDDIESVITDVRYGFIAGALKETMKVNPIQRQQRTEIIDTFLTHRLWGIPIFIFFMWFMFYSTFTLGAYPQEWIENLFSWVAGILHNNMPASMFKDLLIDGIIGGVGGVLVFLPNIVILFLFISLMEDTGYMARAVFIMDKAMHKIGLHGKSFIPLLMGFGCNVPAIMATRIIESRRDRMITMLINPFMSCSARLPVYVLFISAFFVSNQGTILFLIYLSGVFIAIVSALLLKRTLFKGQDMPFVMELPPYRVPTTKSIVKHMWFRSAMYVKKVGGTILIATFIIWFLGYFPHSNESNKNKEFTYIGMIGKKIQPVLAPLGMDWKMSVSIVSGLAAKEIVVSTMGVLYQAEDEGTSLVKKIKQQTYSNGNPVFTPLIALSFMFFILIYFPCMGVVAAIRRESGHWKWPLFSVVYSTSLAWFIAFLIFQIGTLMGY